MPAAPDSRRKALLILTFAALCLTAATRGQSAAPAFTPGKSISIPYARKVDFNHLDNLLRIHASINGGPSGEFVVDTGSVGIVVGADDVPDIDPKAPPATFTYSSSGREMHGVWTVATIKFTDAQGDDASAVVPIFAVKSEVCTGTGVNSATCRPIDHPHPHMMGVGFGRGGDTGHADHNPFLNLKAMQAGAMHRGYVIGREGFTLGLNDKSAAPGYVWQKLTEKADAHAAGATLKEWETAPGSFSIKGAPGGKGTILMDTGLTNMMLASPDTDVRGELKSGIPITIDLLGGQLHYSFTTGDDKDPQCPRKVSLIKPTHGVFVNTGLHALTRFDYLFDADGGWLALRPIAP